jgi:nucleoid-associated protein YgaU
VLARQRTGSAAEARSLAAESPTPVSGAKASASAAEIAAAGASGAGVAALHPSGVSARLVANVSGATRSAATRDEAAAATRFHTVGSGDTLAKISAQYYGTPSRWSDILAANRDILGRENNLVIGRTLRIP